MSALWQSTLNQIRENISESTFNAWFSGIQCIDVDEEGATIHLGLPNGFIKNWINDYYHDLIVKSVTEQGQKPFRVEYQVLTGQSIEEVPGLAATPLITTAPSAVSPVIAVEAVKAPIPEQLNPKYDFDKFVVGSANQFAHAAAKAVADLPGGQYNPLFIYGGVGLGKTHLLNAIGIHVTQRYPQCRCIYVSGERFMNELINTIRFGKMEEFRAKFREGCDLLLIDDIQFIAGKERTQEEFFHTFNTLHGAQKQIVLTSDRLPKDMTGLEERLRSRFEWGLIADIQPPDLETRVAILKKKAENDRIPIDDDVAMFLATAIKSNIRELEGALIRLSAFSSLNGRPITLELTQDVFRHILRDQMSACSIESIQKLVSDYYQIKVSDLKSARRVRSLVEPRQVAMYLCKKHLHSSFPEIGHKFGGKDHTTVMHAVRKIEALIPNNTKMRDDVAFLEKSLKN
ncbi:MAG: chromosomal replication initiator protein DnaA [Deltaproteobacteria bacterium CG11_big_fil_rev_8_21_14_0_20_47_16]|nr:MAG: chromosomal replication initiator protein DnaA [Deltaproteobacteria bacterium CG11_big_fil_rev_8_21_14_0_20_47_16]